MLAKHLIGVVIDVIDLRSGFYSFPGRADHERSFPSFRNREHDILGRHSKVLDLLFAKLSKVFETFDCFNEREIAAGHNAQGAALELFRRT